MHGFEEGRKRRGEWQQPQQGQVWPLGDQSKCSQGTFVRNRHRMRLVRAVGGVGGSEEDMAGRRQ